MHVNGYRLLFSLEPPRSGFSKPWPEGQIQTLGKFFHFMSQAYHSASLAYVFTIDQGISAQARLSRCPVA